MSFMTKLDGVPDRDDAKPGMAFFADTGPCGTTCGGCRHRGMYRESRVGSYSAEVNRLVFKTYRTRQCALFKKMTGIHGPDVQADYPSCKYYEAKKK